MIRIDWHGKEQASNKFDTSSRINAFIEFEKSLSHHIPLLKSSYQENIWLQPLLRKGGEDTTGTHPHVAPSHFKLKF